MGSTRCLQKVAKATTLVICSFWGTRNNAQRHAPCRYRFTQISSSFFELNRAKRDAQTLLTSLLCRYLYEIEQLSKDQFMKKPCLVLTNALSHAIKSLAISTLLIGTSIPVAHAWEACYFAKDLPSPRSNQRAAIRFALPSNFRSTVKIYWIDQNGRTKLYKTLWPGQSYLQQSYLNHQWMINDGANCEYPKVHSKFTSILIPND